MAWSRRFKKKKKAGVSRFKAVHLEFTSRCNLSCIFCFASQPEYAGKDMDPKILDRIISELAHVPVDVICVNGHGETTIYPEWNCFAERLLAAGKPLHITSNFAKPFSDAEVATLSRFRSVEISCDTADPDLFARLRRGADLKTVLENLKRVQQAAACQKKTPGFSFSCVVSDANIFHLQALAELGKEMEVRNFNFCNLTKYPDVAGGFNVNHIAEMDPDSMKAARDSIKATSDFLKQSGIDFRMQSGLLETLEASIENKSSKKVKKDEAEGETAACGPRRYFTRRQSGLTRDCLDPWSFMLINSRGEVLPCCWHHAVGSLGHGQSVFDVFRGIPIQELRSQLLSGELALECQSCPSRSWTTPRQLQSRVNRYLHPVIGRIWPRQGECKGKVMTKFSYTVKYGRGWHDPEKNINLPEKKWKSWRWTAGSAEFSVSNPHRDLTLMIRGAVDKTKFSDQRVSIFAENGLLDTFIPQGSRFQREYLLSSEKAGNSASTTFRIETDKVFVPALTEPGSCDQRELGLQIYEIFVGEKKLV